MKFKVTYAHNFVRIFRLPDEFPSEYCFGGGHPVTIQLMDWFNPFPQEDFWADESKEFEHTDPQYREHVEKLKEFVKGRQYFEPGRTFMALTDYGDAFVINPERRANLLQLEMDAIKSKLRSQNDEGPKEVRTDPETEATQTETQAR